MSEPTHITDHAARADAFVLSAFDDAPRLHALLAAIMAEVQTFEDLAWAVYLGRPLATAVGVNLDTWGKRLKLPRTSTDDDLYRARLQVELLVLHSRGGCAELQEIVARLVGAPVRYRQIGIACAQLDYEAAESTSATTRADVAAVLPRAAGHGVSWQVGEALPSSLRYDSGPGYDDGGYGALIVQENP